jgi:hypothetical protein
MLFASGCRERYIEFDIAPLDIAKKHRTFGGLAVIMLLGEFGNHVKSICVG